MPPRRPRPQLGTAIRAIVRDVAEKLPELAHIKASKILVVAGEARRASRATIRPLGGPRQRAGGDRPRVTLRGKRILYVITLRPMFFRKSTLETRLATLLHELFHISGRFDGTLHRARRHAQLPGKRFGAKLDPLLQRYLETAKPGLLDLLARDGEVLVRHWLEKPPLRRSGRGRRVYTEEQLYLGPVRMITER